MLDMGGIPTATTSTRINVGKNNKVRAVLLDFHLITRSIEQRRREAETTAAPAPNKREEIKPLGEVKPDISLVEKMANLLNIKLGDSSPVGQRKSTNEDTDDLSSILLGQKENKSVRSAQPLKSTTSPHLDIRSKYASKLRNKIDGGVAGIDLMKYEKEEGMKRGDASLHLGAKALLSTIEDAEGANVSSSRWLATTGVGKLLSFLTSRSMQIVLLPIPSTETNPQYDSDATRNLDEMTALTKQLPHVHFDLLISDGRGRNKDSNNATEDILSNVQSTLDIPPLQYLLVSDRDDYLRTARQEGMFTCRVRPTNARRGEVTASYNVEDVGEVEGVVNEINGISFNSALKR